jgi:hypothetical protein
LDFSSVRPELLTVGGQNRDIGARGKVLEHDRSPRSLNLRKTFGGVIAVDAVSFDVRR